MDSKILEQNLKCPICLCLAENPYESSCCGHIFCNKCTKNIGKTCPICRNEKFTFRENYFAKRLLNEVKVKCHFGCSQLVEFAQMRIHRYTCDSILFNCKIKDCTISGNKKELLKHVSEEHADYIISMAENYSTFEKKMDKLMNHGNTHKVDFKIKKKKEEEVKEMREITERYIRKYKTSPIREYRFKNHSRNSSLGSIEHEEVNQEVSEEYERTNNINTHWVEDIMTLTKCTKEKAMLSLIDSDGDIVNAIMKITSEMNDNEENKNNN